MADALVTSALSSLAADRLSRSAAVDLVPRSPGLYAVHGVPQPEWLGAHAVRLGTTMMVMLVDA